MTSLSIQLTAYEALRQQHTEQMDGALQHLYDYMTRQLEQLQEQEQALLEAQTVVVSSLRSTVEADARCLLLTPEFEQFVQRLIADRPRFPFLANRIRLLTPEPQDWLLKTQPLPLEMMRYEAVCDESAYNDENYYTDYRYELTARLGSWQKTISISTASLHPGNPMSYHIKSLRSQHHDVAYRLLEADLYRLKQSAEPDFPELNLDVEQVVQLKQEMSCLLAFVGDLFNLYSRVERFCYPYECRDD